MTEGQEEHMRRSGRRDRVLVLIKLLQRVGKRMMAEVTYVAATQLVSPVHNVL